jgi:hypothetical protein
LGLIFTGAALASGWAAILGVVLLLVGAIYGAVRGTVISAAKIDKTNVWVRGIHRDFLNQLPEWPAA